MQGFALLLSLLSPLGGAGVHALLRKERARTALAPAAALLSAAGFALLLALPGEARSAGETELLGTVLRLRLDPSFVPSLLGLVSSLGVLLFVLSGRKLDSRDLVALSFCGLLCVAGSGELRLLAFCALAAVTGLRPSEAAADALLLLGVALCLSSKEAGRGLVIAAAVARLLSPSEGLADGFLARMQGIALLGAYLPAVPGRVGPLSAAGGALAAAGIVSLVLLTGPSALWGALRAFHAGVLLFVASVFGAEFGVWYGLATVPALYGKSADEPARTTASAIAATGLLPGAASIVWIAGLWEYRASGGMLLAICAGLLLVLFIALRFLAAARPSAGGPRDTGTLLASLSIGAPVLLRLRDPGWEWAGLFFLPLLFLRVPLHVGEIGALGARLRIGSARPRAAIAPFRAWAKRPRIARLAAAAVAGAVLALLWIWRVRPW
jgi:hypothetical protein